MLAALPPQDSNGAVKEASARWSTMRLVVRPSFGIGSLLVTAILSASFISAVGCGSSGDSSSSGPFQQLQELAPVDQGTPVLLFVYTDG